MIFLALLAAMSARAVSYNESTVIPSESTSMQKPDNTEGKKVGPCKLDMGCFKVDVPKGWYVYSANQPGDAKSMSMVTIKPIVRPEGCNFGWSVDFFYMPYRGTTAEKKLDEFKSIYKEFTDKGTAKLGSLSYQWLEYRTEMEGLNSLLVTPLQSDGFFSVSVRGYEVNQKDLKKIMKSIKLAKAQ